MNPKDAVSMKTIGKIIVVCFLISIVTLGIYVALSTEKKYANVIFYTDEGEYSFLCEIANDTFSKKLGLIGRDQLGENQGMLFVYDSADMRLFHMRDMNFPIDIIFIDSNETVLNVVKANISDEHIESNGLAQFVVEINYGLSHQIGIREGTSVKILYI